MDRNNKSRKIFSEFLLQNNLTRDDKRNVFNWGNKKWAFCLNDHYSKIVTCRQLYDDCIGFVSYDEDLGQYKMALRKNISTKTPSRISPNGMCAYSVKVDYNSLAKVGFTIV